MQENMDPITFPSVGVFPTNGTVFLAPTVTDALLNFIILIMIILTIFMTTQIHITYRESGFRIVRLQKITYKSVFTCNGIYL